MQKLEVNPRLSTASFTPELYEIMCWKLEVLTARVEEHRQPTDAGCLFCQSIETDHRTGRVILHWKV